MNNRQIWKKDCAPLLLLIYNRPDKTKMVFDVIRRVKPSKIFIAADGPKEGDKSDSEACDETRKIVKKIDWRCDVKRLYRKKNLGLEKAIGGGLDWFFDNVDSGIILEDDCLPDKSFFEFCSSMLDIYRKDSKVLLIRGDNPVGRQTRISQNYYFSKYIGMWGWATWKRAWNLYDGTMRDWPKFKREKIFNSTFKTYWEKIYWHILLNATYAGKTNSWGYRWMYSVWKNGGKIVTPDVNLVKNIGFSGKKTHFTLRSFENSVARIKKPYVLIGNDSYSKNADRKISKYFYGISPLMALAQYVYYRLK